MSDQNESPDAGGPLRGSAAPKGIDVFTCLHSRDADYLWPLVLEAKKRFMKAPGRYVVVTNEPEVAREVLAQRQPDMRVEVWADKDILSATEMELPGWYRQQVIKLRAHRFFESEVFCNLGADMILLRDLERTDLVGPTGPYLWYSTHDRMDRHLVYEAVRVLFTGRTLGVVPRRALRHPDYINDLFCFSREFQQELEAHMVKRYGPDPYTTLLKGRGNASLSQVRFGEWTLYATFVQDVLKANVELRDTRRNGLLEQVHSERALESLTLTAKAAHLVPKQMDKDLVNRTVKAAWNVQ